MESASLMVLAHGQQKKARGSCPFQRCRVQAGAGGEVDIASTGIKQSPTSCSDL